MKVVLFCFLHMLYTLPLFDIDVGMLLTCQDFFRWVKPLGCFTSHAGDMEANNTGALQRRVNASEAVVWVLAHLQNSAPEMVTAVDTMGRTAGVARAPLE